MKKIISCLMAVVLSLGLLGNHLQSVRAEELIPEGVLELVAELGYYKEGDVVEVKLYVRDYEIGALDFLLSYDKNVLEIKDKTSITYNNLGQAGETLSWNTLIFEEFQDAETGAEYLNIAMLEEIAKDACLMSENGYLASLYFDVKEDFAQTTVEFSDLHSVTKGYGEGWYERISCNVEGILGKQEGKVVLSSVSTEAARGLEAELPINITENSGFNALGITITYDKNICEYEGLTISAPYKESVKLKSVYVLPEGGVVKASFISEEDISITGNFAIVSFQVKEEASVGEKCDVSITIDQVVNQAETTVTGTGSTGTIMVIKGKEDNQPSSYTLGDVNEDGNINLIDAVYILHWYNGVRELSAAQKLAADTDRSGVVNLLDAVQIMRYFNGEIRNF